MRVKRLLYGPYASGETLLDDLRSKGMVIGEDTVVHDCRNVFIDPSRPWMVEMGRNVQITRGVTILTHSYDWSVFKGWHGDVLGSAGRVKIGDNVFIGMNSTILKGVTVGDNVIIGANSLINKDVPSSSVVVGNPQRVVCTIDEHLEKLRAAQLDEAADLYDCWRRNSPEGKRGGVPPKSVFHEFFWLFEERGENGFTEPTFESVMGLCGTYDKSVARFARMERRFACYDEFIDYLESQRH